MDMLSPNSQIRRDPWRLSGLWPSQMGMDVGFIGQSLTHWECLMADEDRVPLRKDYPQDHLAAIGHVAVLWGYLEMEVDQMTWVAGGFDHQFAACVTAQMISIHPKLRALISLIWLRGVDEGLVKELRAFQGSVGDLVDKRNRAVHDPRAIRTSDGAMLRMQITAANTLSFAFLPEKREDIELTAKKISEKIVEFKELKARILAEIAASPNKRRQQPLELH